MEKSRTSARGLCRLPFFRLLASPKHARTPLEGALMAAVC